LTELFRTVHGSRLYGLNTPDSDYDQFIVTMEDNGKSSHRVDSSGRFDTVRVGWRTWLEHAESGSHQSVEALFSTRKTWSDGGGWLQPMVENMYITGPDVIHKYKRTITKFCYGPFKKRRHAVRLSLNMRDLRWRGRFDPQLTTAQIYYVNHMAQYEGGELADWLLND